MMWNHGVVVGDKDMFSAFMVFETFEHCAKLQVDALRIGQPRGLTQQQIELSGSRSYPMLDTFVPKVHTSEEKAVRREMCHMVHRAYRQRLIGSTQGTFSQRLSLKIWCLLRTADVRMARSPAVPPFFIRRYMKSILRLILL